MPKASRNPTQRPAKRAPQQPSAPERRTAREVLESILGIGVVVFAAIAVLGFAGTLAHVAFRDGNPFFASVAWQWAYWLPLLALPLMIVCVVTLIILSAVGKARRR